MAGVMQYGVVGGIILMYLSYSVDFWLLEKDERERRNAAAAAKQD